MTYFLIKLVFAASPLMVSGYDIFSGLLQLKTACFEEVNTFDSANCDRNNTLSQVFVPDYKGVNTNPMNTKCFLFTYKNQYAAEFLHKCGGMLPINTAFDKTVDTIVITHGFLDGICRTSWPREFKTQFFKRGRYNVLLCDWTWGNTPDAPSAALNSIVAGKDIGFMVRNIMLQKNVNGSRFYFVGHSYGSYALNAAAKYIRDKDPSKKIRRMTWLDPANGPFPYNNPKNFLDYDNAVFVDAIHSGSGVCLPFRFGVLNPVAHADFYPNGGRTNEACYPYAVTSIAKGDLLYGLVSIIPQLCYHLQSIQFFKVSINKPDNSSYIGVLCDSYESFQNGTCKRCCATNFSQCAVAGVDAEFYFPFIGDDRQPRRYYFNTEIPCPYPEDYEFSIFKDCPNDYQSIIQQSK